MPLTKSLDSTHCLFSLLQCWVAFVAHDEQDETGCGERDDEGAEPVRFVKDAERFQGLHKPYDLHGCFDTGTATCVSLQADATVASHVLESVVEEGAVEDHLNVCVGESQEEL